MGTGGHRTRRLHLDVPLSCRVGAWGLGTGETSTVQLTPYASLIWTKILRSEGAYVTMALSTWRSMAHHTATLS